MKESERSRRTSSGPGRSMKIRWLFWRMRSVGAALWLISLSIGSAQPAVEAWVRRYSHAAESSDAAQKVTVDKVGNVIVAGYTGDGISGLDFLTIKYSGAGVPLWTNRYNGPAKGDDQATAVAVDTGGNVLVTGFSYASMENSDYATIKYSAAGVPLWTNRYNGPANSEDRATAVAVDTNGNVYVTGYSATAGFPNFNFNYATIAYSAAGVPLWTNRYHAAGSGEDVANAVAVDSSGNVFVTGTSDFDYATVAYSSAGVPLWTNRYNGPANGDDQPQTKSCMAVGPGGAVYVVGASDGDYSSMGTTYDYATIKYADIRPHLSIEPDGFAGYFVRFEGIPGFAYRLQRATALTGPWISSAPQIALDSGLVEFWDFFPPPTQAFYRARLE